MKDLNAFKICFQISGDLDLAKDALVQIATRLRANLFDRESSLSTLVPVLPYLPVPGDRADGLNYDSRDSARNGHMHHSVVYASSDLVPTDYESYSFSQVLLSKCAVKPLIDVFRQSRIEESAILFILVF